MYLREKLEELKMLRQKVKELSSNLLVTSDERKKDDLAKALFKSMDDIQNIKLILAKVNMQTQIEIGETSINTSTAVIIRDNLKCKIDLISDIIHSNTGLDVLALIKQRDVLLTEYNSINKSIRLMDWSVSLD